MSWYYAENNDRRGPVDEAAFNELVNSGAIRSDTLVWREGMPQWQPYGQVIGQGAVPSAPPLASGGVRCASCGEYFAESDVISIGGRPFCASCKPLALQHLVEGTEHRNSSSLDPEKLLNDLRARGGYPIEIGRLLRRSWALVKGNFWPCVGTTLLAYLVMMISQQIPCVGVVAPFFITGPIFGGLFLYFLKQFRGQPATVNDAFSGFNKPHFKPLALAGSVQTAAVIVVTILFLIPVFIFNFTRIQQNSPDLLWTFLPWVLAAMIPLTYLWVSWIFSYAFIIDHGMRFWPAMELSRKLVNMNLLGWFLFMLVSFLLSMAGILALCVGEIVVMPVLVGAIMALYEEILALGGQGNR